MEFGIYDVMLLWCHSLSWKKNKQTKTSKINMYKFKVFELKSSPIAKCKSVFHWRSRTERVSADIFLFVSGVQV